MARLVSRDNGRRNSQKGSWGVSVHSQGHHIFRVPCISIPTRIHLKLRGAFYFLAGMEEKGRTVLPLIHLQPSFILAFWHSPFVSACFSPSNHTFNVEPNAVPSEICRSHYENHIHVFLQSCFSCHCRISFL